MLKVKGGYICSEGLSIFVGAVLVVSLIISGLGVFLIMHTVEGLEGPRRV